MTPILEIDLLRTLVAVADTGSFTRAGDEVLRSQSAVSLQMKKLESVIGRALFQPRGRTVALTEDGRMLVAHARRILRMHQDALSDFSARDESGSVQLGTPDDYADAFLPRLLSRFSSLYPRIRVDVRCEPTPKLLDLLGQGELDLCIASSSVGQEEGVVLQREPVVWIAAPDAFPQEEDPVPLALFSQPCIFHDWALKGMGTAGRRYRIAYTSSNLSALHAAVGAGLAVGVMAKSSCLPEFRLLGSSDGFPRLPDVSISLIKSTKSGSSARERLADHIIRTFDSFDSFVAGGPEHA